MASITATARKIIDIYTGGVGANPPPAGPCNVVYCVNQQGNLFKVAFLSETNYGQLTLTFMVPQAITESEWLTLADTSNIQPIKVDEIDLNRSVLSCTMAKCQELLGNLQTMPLVHCVTPQGKLKKVTFQNPLEKGKPVLGFNITDIQSEAAFIAYDNGSQMVDDIDLAGIVG
jgi:hypothetical protein